MYPRHLPWETVRELSVVSSPYIFFPWAQKEGFSLGPHNYWLIPVLRRGMTLVVSLGTWQRAPPWWCLWVQWPGWQSPQLPGCGQGPEETVVTLCCLMMLWP